MTGQVSTGFGNTQGVGQVQLGTDGKKEEVSVGGEVIEENHYYPLGLTLQTAEAPNVTKNPLKLATKELEKSFGLELYDFGARPYDPQLERWLSIDPLKM